MSSFKESIKQSVDEGLLNELLVDRYREFAEWIGESGYKYDGYKYWIRKYQTPLTYHNTYEEDYLNTEQLVQKYFDNHT